GNMSFHVIAKGNAKAVIDKNDSFLLNKKNKNNSNLSLSPFHNKSNRDLDNLQTKDNANGSFNFLNIPTLNNEKKNIDNSKFKSTNIQFKLKVSQPGDEYEKEADRVAEQIINYDSNSRKKGNPYGESNREKIGSKANKNDNSIKRKNDNKIGNS